MGCPGATQVKMTCQLKSGDSCSWSEVALNLHCKLTHCHCFWAYQHSISFWWFVCLCIYLPVQIFVLEAWCMIGSQSIEFTAGLMPSASAADAQGTLCPPSIKQMISTKSVPTTSPMWRVPCKQVYRVACVYQKESLHKL